MSGHEQWRMAVERGLKGAKLESLVATMLEGIPVQPLYTEQELPEVRGIPEVPRMPRALGTVLRDPADIPDAIEGGASLIWLRLESGPPPALDVQEWGPFLLLESPEPASTAALACGSIRTIADPTEGGRRGRCPSDEAVASIARALERGAAALGVDGTVAERAGGDAIVQLASCACSLVGSLRALEARAMDLERAVAGTTVAVSVGAEFFKEIAKMRALRRIVVRILERAGVSARPWIVARTSDRMQAAVDPANNILRNTLAVAAALIGGADAVAAVPHERSPRGLRLARNLPLVLELESHLSASADPAAGSYYLERLTTELARSAWSLFTEAERDGGRALEARLDISRQKREMAIRTRRLPIVGASRYPGSERAALEANGPRDSEPFERLRARAVPVSRVISLGECPEDRIEFALEIAELASERVVVSKEISFDGESFVILCGPDESIARGTLEAVRALREAGAMAIGLAADPGPFEALLRTAGVDAFVYPGADLVGALEALLDRVSHRAGDGTRGSG